MISVALACTPLEVDVFGVRNPLMTPNKHTAQEHSNEYNALHVQSGHLNASFTKFIGFTTRDDALLRR